MSYLKKFFYGPVSESDGGVDSTIEDPKDPKDIVSDDAAEAPEPKVPDEEPGEEKPVIEKIREALQDWSNKDEADQEFDDTRV